MKSIASVFLFFTFTTLYQQAGADSLSPVLGKNSDPFGFSGGLKRTGPDSLCICVGPLPCTNETSLPSAVSDPLKKSLSPLEQELKSEAELDAYFQAFRKTCSGKYLKKFNEEYKEYLKAAAEAYSLPYVFLACLVFKESKFKNEAVSQKKARGLGQFMQNTSSTISAMIKTSRKPDHHKEFYVGIYDSTTEKINNNIPLTAQEQEDYGMATTKVIYYNLAESWNEYFRKVRTSRGFEKKYGRWTQHYHEVHGSPSTFSYSTGTTIAPHNIGATGFWIGFLNDDLHRSFPQAEVKSGEDEVSKLLLLAAGYNMGPGKMNRHARKYNLSKDNIREVADSLKHSNIETASHVQSIKNCMSKGNDTGPMLIDRKSLKLKPSISTAQICKDNPDLSIEVE